jgi:two-component system CheB/CheR fusion protein
LREPFVVLDGSLRVQTANAAFYKTFPVTKGDTEGRLFSVLGNGQLERSRLRGLLEVLPGNHPRDCEVEHDFPGIGKRILSLPVLSWKSHGLIFSP